MSLIKMETRNSRIRKVALSLKALIPALANRNNSKNTFLPIITESQIFIWQILKQMID